MAKMAENTHHDIAALKSWRRYCWLRNKPLNTSIQLLSGCPEPGLLPCFFYVYLIISSTEKIDRPAI